jgi:hypothetical protein
MIRIDKYTNIDRGSDPTKEYYINQNGTYLSLTKAELEKLSSDLKLLGVSDSLHPLTSNKVDKMLKDISLETFIACGGNKHEWIEWWSKRNSVNVNSNDR